MFSLQKLAKLGLTAVGLVLACVCGLSAEPPQAQWLLNADGAIGVGTAPAALSGATVGGGQLGVEYLASQYLGMDIGYNYLAVGKAGSTASDNDLDLSLRGIPWTWGNTALWLQAGIGYNASANDDNGHYLGFLEPGVRVVVAPRLALDGGIQYLVTTPSANPVQSLGVVLGVSVPLDAPFH